MRAYSHDFRDGAISLFESVYKRRQIVEMLVIHYEIVNNSIRNIKRQETIVPNNILNKGIERKFTEKKAEAEYYSWIWDQLK